MSLPPPVAAAFGRPVTFSDVVVHPTQRLLEPPSMLFQGGPDWPSFWLRRAARHCCFPLRLPLDVRPRRGASEVVRREAQGVWCGPVTRHFGHAVTTFGGRLAASSLLPHYVPLVFSARPGEAPPEFLWRILAHFGVDRRRVMIVDQPTMFDTMTVFPQAETLHGGPPAPAYLDLLDEIAGARRASAGRSLYVSRGGLWKGKIAGETYLETVLERCGYWAFRPEEHPLAEQLDAYRQAPRIIFAEGSAIHGAQLLGRLGADVAVIVRRGRSRIAEAALRPRVRSLRYIDAVRGMIFGSGRDGRPQRSAGLSLLDADALVRGLAAFGVDAGSLWDDREFGAHVSTDLDIWREARRRHPVHRRDEILIRRSLARVGVD